MSQQPLSSSVQPTDTYGGDEVSALVLDPGYCYTRAGFAGEDSPKMVIPSFYHHSSGRDIFGDPILMPRAGLEVRNYMNRDSIVEDWDAATRVWEHLLVDRLQAPRPTPPSKNQLNVGDDGDVEMGDGGAAEEATDGLEKPLAENPLLVAEANWNPPKAREKAIEVCMETWGCPAFWLSRTSVLASFAAGKPTALVVDVGGANTSVTAVHDGIFLKRSVQRSPAAGVWLSNQIRSMWKSNEPKVDIVPFFMVESKKPVEAGAPADARLRTFDFPITDSFRAFEEERVLKEFKESVVEVWRGPGRFMAPGNEDYARSQPGRVFEMPDGANQMWREQRYRVAEGMWDETAAYPPVVGDEAPLSKAQTIPALIKASLDGVDVDLRPHLLANVVVTGSTSLLNGFNDRLNQELTAMYPGLRIKIHAAGLTSERKNGAWLGGSILASLGTFHQMWISRHEYDENGPGIVEKRCK
ncbi:17d11f09-ac06-4c34-a366-304b0cc16418 [Thermothielavioides terrestris]|uniref:ARP4-like protein n=2 Tax=Thermothielavioides terrestris TaxID=2587410 RepID=G2RFN5_THETT|nr:ARP4-like protein [Thermothielavioides terrestris NRRL 8126]AEO70518.1 ARP4-like protein [Thermothielavioides terrestris NRRL 8126]SPQ18348.1 17d11f09-ac06-4c34-a366-304b0cc16418 [Thermothielavioides terrestris]